MERPGGVGMALKLTLANAPEGAQGDFEFDSVGRVAIGRDPACEWVIPDPTRGVSGRHCEIISDGATFTLRDTSTNGVFVNGAAQRLEQAHVLRAGDSFSVGRFMVRVESTNAPARAGRAPGEAVPPPLPRDVGLRGADPAAMVAAGGRGFAAPESGLGPVDGGMTMIRPAPRPSAAPPPAPVAAPTPPPVPAAPPAPANNPWMEPASAPREPTPAPPAATPAPATALAAASVSLSPFAEALGLSPSEFAAQDPETTLRRAGALLAAFASGYATLLAEQGQARRKLGSRQLARPVGLQAGASAFVGSTAKTLARLLSEPGSSALVADAAASIAAHQRALLGGALSAAGELGLALEPDRLGAADGPFFAEHYRNLWAGIDAKWSSGFEEAFRLHFGEAYDETARDSGEGKR